MMEYRNGATAVYCWCPRASGQPWVVIGECPTSIGTSFCRGTSARRLVASSREKKVCPSMRREKPGMNVELISKDMKKKPMQGLRRGGCRLPFGWSSGAGLEGGWTMCSNGAREAETLVFHVELGVVLADEHVPQDPQRAVGRRYVQPHEPGQTHRLAELRHLPQSHFATAHA